MSSFYIIGSDKRIINIKEMYEKEGIVANNYLQAKYIICPTPFSKDKVYITGTDMKCEEIIDMCKGRTLFAGAIPSIVKEKLDKENITYYDLMDYDDLAILNAIPTCEGAIKIAIEKTDITLCGSNVLVLGFGRIGKVLCKMLSGIGSKVYCEARNEKDLAQIRAMGYNDVDLNNLEGYLPKADYIFSTIPHMILDSGRLDLVKEDVCIIDLASSPGSVDFEYAKGKNINTSLELALPAKVASKSSAMYFKDKIDKIIQEIENN